MDVKKKNDERKPLEFDEMVSFFMATESTNKCEACGGDKWDLMANSKDEESLSIFTTEGHNSKGLNCHAAVCKNCGLIRQYSIMHVRRIQNELLLKEISEESNGEASDE